MNASSNPDRDRLLKHRRRLIVILAACFLAGPVLFWQDIRSLRPQALAVFVVGYVIVYTSLFWFYVDRYRSAKHDKSDSP